MINRLILAQRIGRLGNQVYLLAHLLAFWQATGIGFAHPTLGEYGRFFKGTASDPFARFPASRVLMPRSVFVRNLVFILTRLFDKACGLLACRRDWVRIDFRETFDLSSPEFLARCSKRRHTFLSGGWRFQYPTITADFFPLAREFFALAGPYAQNVARLVEQVRQGCDLLIGVHIRQTDFKEHAGGKFYFTTQEYASIMNRSALLFPHRKVHFLVVSDEPKTDSDFPGLTCFFGTGIPVEDMYALGACDYVISNIASSFSLWPTVLYQVPNYRARNPGQDFSHEDFKILTDPWKYTT